MEGKIIKLKQIKEEGKCLICGNKPATINFEICRTKHGDNVIVFCVCDECIAQMQKDIETCD